MSNFESLKEQNRIQEVKIDKSEARGLLKRSKRRFRIQKDKDITEENAFEILESVYESIRETLEAGMSSDGLNSEDHVATIAYGEEKLDLDRSTVNKLHRFRKLRNKSRYEAKEIRSEEAEQILELAENLLPEQREKVEQKL